jgi:hypothetical protein
MKKGANALFQVVSLSRLHSHYFSDLVPCIAEHHMRICQRVTSPDKQEDDTLGSPRELTMFTIATARSPLSVVAGVNLL